MPGVNTGPLVYISCFVVVVVVVVVFVVVVVVVWFILKSQK